MRLFVIASSVSLVTTICLQSILYSTQRVYVGKRVGVRLFDIQGKSLYMA